MTPSFFIDSWGWVVLASKQDPQHSSLQQWYREERERGHRIVTTDYVLDEVITLLYAKIDESLATQYIQGIMAGIVARTIDLERMTAKRFDQAWKMRLKYRDHHRISFTDFTSFVVMQERRIHHVVTNDKHFTHVNLGFQLITGSHISHRE